jgi:hypothetical protein
MQKVVGSSPIIRSKKPPEIGGFVVETDNVSPKCVPDSVDETAQVFPPRRLVGTSRP